MPSGKSSCPGLHSWYEAVEKDRNWKLWIYLSIKKNDSGTDEAAADAVVQWEGKKLSCLSVHVSRCISCTHHSSRSHKIISTPSFAALVVRCRIDHLPAHLASTARARDAGEGCAGEILLHGVARVALGTLVVSCSCVLQQVSADLNGCEATTNMRWKSILSMVTSTLSKWSKDLESQDNVRLPALNNISWSRHRLQRDPGPVSQRNGSHLWSTVSV